MQIWVDADACPAVIKEILYRAAERVQIPMTLVANKALRVPASRFIRTLQIEFHERSLGIHAAGAARLRCR